MKHLWILFLFGSLIIFLNSCGPSPKEAVDYNDSVILEQIAIVDAIDALDASFEEYIPEEMDQALANAIKTTEHAIDAIKAKENFDGSDEFKNNALDLFKLYKDVLENEFQSMVDIYKLPDDEYTDTESERWEVLYNQAYEKMINALESFNDYQKEFSKKYQFSLEDKAEDSI
jgi:hypothetical protein